MPTWRNKCEPQYTVELHSSTGIQACFELRMDASKYAPFEVRTFTIVHELGLMNCFLFFVCFVLIGNKLYSFQHQTDERESSALTSRPENSQADSLPKLSLVLPFCALYHQNGSTYKAINCCSTVCHVDGHLVSVLNSLLKRVLHVLRNTLGQLLRSFSAPLRNLSRSKRPNEVKTVCFTNPLHSILVSAD